MSISDEDIAVGSDQNIRGLIEGVGTIPSNSSLSQRQQYLAFGAEFKNLLAFSVLALGIGDPDIACFVDKDTVGKDKQTPSETLEQLARRSELEDGSNVGASATIGAAPLSHPDVAISADVYSAGRTQ